MQIQPKNDLNTSNFRAKIDIYWLYITLLCGHANVDTYYICYGFLGRYVHML